MKYMLVQAPDPVSLCRLVDRHLVEGWEPQGGASQAVWLYPDREGGVTVLAEYTQAMILKAQ